MRIYRVCYESLSEGGQGFLWFPSNRAAQKDLAAYRRTDSSPRKHDSEESKVQAIDFTPTKKGIIALLNEVANHPDNG